LSDVIETGYKPREQQREIHKAVAGNRFVVVVAHRRMGKTVAAINQLIHLALLCEKPNPRYAYIAPTYGQAKRIAWDYLVDFTRPLGATANISELRVDFYGRRIQLYGSDNPDSLRGQYFDAVVLDEIGDQNPKIWNEIIRPALADRSGGALFLGTPKGANHFKDFRDRAEKEPNWALLEFRASQTNILPQEELEAARKEMGEDKYAQEFECSFNAAIEGSYYGQIINSMGAERFTEFATDNLCKTYTAWDLGVGDSTAIWVCQVAGQERRLIDFVENHGQGLDWYVSWIKNNGYTTAEHILPHDVEVRELGTGKSRKETLQDLGLNITVCPRLAVDDGIQAVRRMLPNCYFHPRTKQGLDALRNYRREYDEKRQIFYDKPLHDWSSHCFVGATEVLTHNGMCQIMNLPYSGKVLTKCGWKDYRNPRITQKNAPLVEVVFADGYSVKCTPEHLFLTENGWKSAKLLTKGTLIQSYLTPLHSILMAACIGFGLVIDIFLVAAKSCIEMFGGLRLVKFLMDATFTTKTIIRQTISWITLSVFLQKNICLTHGTNQEKTGKNIFLQKPEKKLLNGISQKKVGFGTNAMRNKAKVGLNGSENLNRVSFAEKNLMHWLEKAAMLKNIVTLTAKRRTIEKVKMLDEVSDVWCLTVPNEENFTLANGAIVHNCADAFRYLAVGLNTTSNWGKPLPINTKWIV
jgi:phage terminase large subunit